MEATLTLNGPVTVSFSGEGADGVAGFLCAHLNSHLHLDSLAEPQEDASNTEGGFGKDCGSTSSADWFVRPRNKIQPESDLAAMHGFAAPAPTQFAACLDTATRTCYRVQVE